VIEVMQRHKWLYSWLDFVATFRIASSGLKQIITRRGMGDPTFLLECSNQTVVESYSSLINASKPASYVDPTTFCQGTKHGE
jgi:hypothetical protein